MSRQKVASIQGLSRGDYATSILHMAAQSAGDSIPYLVEPISQTPNEEIFTEIAEMCIDVFFKESLGAKPEDKIA